MDSESSCNFLRHSYVHNDHQGVEAEEFVSMDLERIKKLEESVLALQIGNSTVPKRNEVDTDVIARLTNLEASVTQEREIRSDLKRKLKLANTQNSRLQLRLKKEKARHALSGYRARGARLPVTPENKAILHTLIPGDSRISKSMNDIFKATRGNQGRQILDSSDSQDEDSIPKVHSQLYSYMPKSDYTRGGSLEVNIPDGAQRIGVRMDGEQALQLLPSYQQTIIQQQQEIRELCSKVRSMESKHTALIEATQDGVRIEESLSTLSLKSSQIETLKQKIRELQIGLIEFENERNDAVNLARDLSLQLTRAKLAKDTALRTSRQLMEQFPTRPPRDRTPDSSIPSTPSQIDLVPMALELPPSSLKSSGNSRYLPQPPLQSRPSTPKIITTNDCTSNPAKSPNYESSGLPRSVQFFKKSVQEQSQADTLPSRLVIKSAQQDIVNSKPTQTTTTTTRTTSTASSNQDRLSPLQESPSHSGPQMFRLRSDSSPELCPNPHDISVTDPQASKGASKQKHKQVNVNIPDGGGKHSSSGFASGFGFKGKSKDKVKMKKVRTVEEPLPPSGIGKIHKRFSSLNSLPNAFKRSPKLEDKKKPDSPAVQASDRKHKSRPSGDDLEIEFKHVTNPNLPFNHLKSPNGISLNKTQENLNTHSSGAGALVRAKKSQEINSLPKENKLCPSDT